MRHQLLGPKSRQTARPGSWGPDNLIETEVPQRRPPGPGRARRGRPHLEGNPWRRRGGGATARPLRAQTSWRLRMAPAASARPCPACGHRPGRRPARSAHPAGAPGHAGGDCTAGARAAAPRGELGERRKQPLGGLRPAPPAGKAGVSGAHSRSLLADEQRERAAGAPAARGGTLPGVPARSARAPGSTGPGNFLRDACHVSAATGKARLCSLISRGPPHLGLSPGNPCDPSPRASSPSGAPLPRTRPARSRRRPPGPGSPRSRHPRGRGDRERRGLVGDPAHSPLPNSGLAKQ